MIGWRHPKASRLDPFPAGHTRNHTAMAYDATSGSCKCSHTLSSRPDRNQMNRSHLTFFIPLPSTSLLWVHSSGSMPQITLWFLQASRSIRTAWLLEELGLDYTLKFSERVNQKAPPEFKAGSNNPLGKFPTIQDGSLTVYESGAINEYVGCLRKRLIH
jgi:hypothetical protein